MQAELAPPPAGLAVALLPRRRDEARLYGLTVRNRVWLRPRIPAVSAVINPPIYGIFGLATRSLRTVKILHIGKYFPPFCGGMETFLRDLAHAQARSGLDVSVLAHNHRFGEGAQEERAEAAGGTLHLLRAATRGTLAFTPLSPGYRRLLARLIAARGPDLIHIHAPNPNAFWLLTLAAARRIPWVVHWHSDVVASPRDWRLRLGYQGYRPFEQRLLRRARAVAVTSEAYWRSSEPLRPWAGRCRVIPLGMEPARIRAAAAAGDAAWGAGLRVLAVGRLTYYKGFEYLIRAAAGRPGLSVRIVGEGEQRPLLEREIAAANAGDQVRLMGRRSDPEVAALMAECDLLCLPSVERTEAFGMVLLEAMACAKPCLVTDVAGSGMSWVVKDKITGFVTRAEDAAALRRALAEAKRLKTAGGLAEMGERGRERFIQEFAIDRTVERLNALYQDVLE